MNAYPKIDATSLSLTPCFSGVPTVRPRSENCFNSLSVADREWERVQGYVSPCIFAGLVARGLVDVGTPSFARKARGSKAFEASARLRKAKGDLHEDQLRERRPCSCVDRFANATFNRRHDATVKRQFISLGERTKSGAGQVWMGARIRSLLSVTIRDRRSLGIHSRPGGTPSTERLRRRTKAVCRAIRTGVAQGLKPLKRFPMASAEFTPLKWGVNERQPQAACQRTRLMLM
jgi:hypothetical protein